MTMTKNIVLTIFITFLSYAIVSDLGKPQHTYSGLSPTALANQNLQ